jgi:Fanconi anemia group M protein
MSFHDIFKKSERASKKPVQSAKILIDNHEKNSLVPAILSKLKMNYEFTHLEVADYLINNIAIERKTIPDLKSSIISKRILFQLKELKQYPKSLLIVEGISNFALYEGIIHENALRGFILSTSLEHKIPIIFTENEEDTAKYLAVLAMRESKPKTPTSLRQKLALSKEEQKQFILEGFPGIGPSTAGKLIEKFKTIKNIINASEEELKQFLGKKTEIFLKTLEE